MRTQKNVQNMTDRELRTCRKRLLKQRAFRRRCFTCILTICLLFVCTLSYHAIQTSASTGEEELKFKYYTRITVRSGETLWDIADDYIDYSQYKNKNAYIAEVQNINHLSEFEMIKSGQILVVPYYSTEFVK